MPLYTLPTISRLSLALSLLAVTSSTYAANTNSITPIRPAVDNQQLTACLDNLAQKGVFASVKDIFARNRPTEVDSSVLEALNYQPLPSQLSGQRARC